MLPSVHHILVVESPSRVTREAGSPISLFCAIESSNVFTGTDDGCGRSVGDQHSSACVRKRKMLMEA